jgi:hypothetical protein
MADAGTFGALLKAILGATTAWKNSGDGDIAGTSASSVAAFQTLLQEALKEWGTANMKDMLKRKPTAYLENAIALVSVLELVNGFGSPDKAAVLSDIAKPNFEAALANLRLAVPDELRWSGPAALAYAELNNKVQQCVQAVQAADVQFQDYVKTQAGLVLSVRQRFTYTKTALVAAIPIAWTVYLCNYTALLAQPENWFIWGEQIAHEEAMAITNKFQATVILTALGNLGYWTYDHVHQVGLNATKMQNSVPGQYDAAKKMAPLANTTVRRSAVTTTAGTSTVSAFPTLSRAGSNISGTSARPYPVAGARPYPVAGASGDYRVASVQDRAQPEARATAAIPFTPAATSPPGFTAPAVPQATHSTKPATAPSENAAATESAPATNVETIGTAVGAEGAERAPIEVAAGSPQRAQQPSLAMGIR